MKDFPVFTTDFGVATLILKEVPYRKEAYVLVRDVQPGGLEDLVKECVSFCRMAGAERVFASGQEGLEAWPLHTILYEMRGQPSLEEAQLENIWPVTEQTVGDWRRLYNERMAGVDHAATLEMRDEESILSTGGAYFIHRRGELLGIGWLEADCLRVIASTVPGMGARVAHTLLSVCPGQTVRLEVASTNQKAIRLYEGLGLLKTAELERWYQIF